VREKRMPCGKRFGIRHVQDRAEQAIGLVHSREDVT
jgi:hypothetical protein